MIATRPDRQHVRHNEKDDIARLVEAYRERGDRRAIERIISKNTRILNHLARRYAGSSNEPYEDLLQVGYVGLIKAVNGYEPDPTRAKFSSYAHAMIEGEIRHHLRDTAAVRRPRWARALYSKITQATDKLATELGRPPLVGEIAREVNVTPEGVTETLKLFLDTDVMSLDGAEVGVDLSAVRSIQPESFSLPIEDRIVLEQALESLTEVQRKVVYLFFYKDLSQTEIGHMLSLSQRKISRLSAVAIHAEG
jgi:RNA polymerase sigma-B factor